ncbi:MAG: TetR/AcrR family transcriptional regulator [Candidatus Omnitrophota bacterium]
MNKTSQIKGTAKDRILEAATDLFYRQGYNATGIQQIIDEAGVSKGTFYTHFATKDELGAAYMRNRHAREMYELREMVGRIKDPYQKYIGFNTIMRDWMVSTEYRGCAFSNMAAEVTDGKSPIRKEAKHHYEVYRGVIREMVRDLIESDPKYKELDPDFVADQYLLIQIGALTNAEIYQDPWPYDQAARAIRPLIGEKG